jgi:tetratricopeptide (TPR) repeat protein
MALSCEDDTPKAYDQQLPIHFQALNNMQKAIEFRDVPSKELSALLFSCYKASNRYSKTMPCQDLISRVFSVLELDPKIALVPYMELYIEEARRLESGTSCKASVSLLDMLAHACESKLSERSSARLRVQHELACVYLRSNQLSRSIELFQHVVKTRGTVLGESSPDYLQSQKMLGEAYRANGQNEEALSLSQSANIKVKPINENHPDYLPSQFQLAMTYLATRRPDKATEVLRHVEKLHAEKIAVNDRPHLTLKFHLARAYLMSGEVKNATELLEEIIDIHIKRGEGEHQNCQNLRYELCHAYNRSGQPHKTVRLLRENLNTQKEITPKNHPAMLTSQFILGLAYNMLGQNKEALRCFQRAVEGRKANGDDPGIFVAWEIELATAYIANVENEKGIEILQGIVKGRETVLPPSDRRLLYIQAQLARAYAHNGQAEESHKLLQHIQYIQEQALGQLHPVR